MPCQSASHGTTAIVYSPGIPKANRFPEIQPASWSFDDYLVSKLFAVQSFRLQRLKRLSILMPMS